MRLPLCYPIESRDGTLNADSKMKNMVVENVEGEQVAVKRPGVTKQTELPPGLAQGLFSLNGVPYSMVGDVLYKIGSGLSWNEAIPPAVNYAIKSGPTYPLLNSEWQIAPYQSYPNYKFVNFTSVSAIVAYMNATYSSAGLWEFSAVTAFASPFSSYPWYIGYVWVDRASDGESYIQVISHTHP